MKKGIIIILLMMMSTLIITKKNNINAAPTATYRTRTSEINYILDDPSFLDTLVHKESTETYQPSSRKFQRMPSILWVGNRVYAAWTAGGITEPHRDNHVVLAVSDDRGETWIDPYIIFDHMEQDRHTTLPMLWMNPQGQVVLSVVSQYTKFIVSDNADAADIRDVKWSKVQQCTTPSTYTKPVTLSNGVSLKTGNFVADRTYVPVSISAPGSFIWEVLSYIQSTAGNNKIWNESQIVEHSDGRLEFLGRIEQSNFNGGMERSWSYDGGTTWTDTEYDLPEPYRATSARFVYSKLKNGNFIMIKNDSASDNRRTNLVILMSEDEGKTWPYRLMLDDRDALSYPDFSEHEDGTLAIIYDTGGNNLPNPFGTHEIRMSFITQDDIIAGEIVSPNSELRKIIYKTDSGIEILSVEATPNYKNKIRKEVGTTANSIISVLPTTITINLENGTKQVLNGSWSSSNFEADKVGMYRFNFTSPDLNISNYQDNYSLLKVYVEIYDKMVKQERTYKNGTTKENIIENLPTTILIYLENDNVKLLKGTWESTDFIENTTGNYAFTFTTTEEIPNCQDNLNKTKLFVTITREETSIIKPSNNSIVPILIGSGSSLIFIGILGVVIVKIRKSRGKKHEKN